jgi:hypothetical protein
MVSASTLQYYTLYSNHTPGSIEQTRLRATLTLGGDRNINNQAKKKRDQKCVGEGRGPRSGGVTIDHIKW